METKPKHKKPWRDSTPRGPERWARAADNAMAHPNSKAAHLFFDRVSAAHRIRLDYPEVAGPFEHMHFTWEWDPIIKSGKNYVPTKRAYVTCSLFCAVMQVQLDWSRSVTDFDELHWFLTFDERAPQRLDPKTLTRDVRCQMCGKVVKA